MRLVDRCAEKQALHELLDSVRAGMSGALVLRGEPGVGKSALLDYAVERAADLQIRRTVAVESERTLGFAAVHQLLFPLLPAVDRLPEPQQRALDVAFGLVSGPPADPFLVGLAVLTLLSDTARVRPVLCVVDDAQWLDDESADTLGFVARRLLADSVGMLFAIRETMVPDPRLQALPGLRVAGLPEPDAYELLARAVGRPIAAGVAQRIIAGTSGNPLAIVEAAAELTPEQLRGQMPLPEPLPVGHQLEDLFVRRARELPMDTQTLLLLVAAEQPGRGDRLWQAAAALGIPESAAVPAEAAGLVAFGPEVRFSHPLVRSAVYHAAAPVQRRQAHRALAAACDPQLDAVPQALHLAAATAGPDEAVAAALEAAADRARSRGGYAATAALLERAAPLTPDEERRAERRLSAAQAHLLAGGVDRAETLLAEAATGLRDPRSTAEATRLEGRIQFHRGQVAAAASTLVGAARRFRPLDPRAARDALLFALEAAVFAGWAPSTPLLHEIARTARDLPPTGPPDSAADLLLRGCTARVTGGYAAAVPALRRMVQAFLADEVDPGVALQRLELAAVLAADLLDDASVERLTADWIDRARASGALARLAAALAFRSAYVDGPAGRLAAARAAEAEAHELAEVTGNPSVVPPTGAHTLLTLALSGREAEARATAAAVAREAPGRGAAGEMAMAASFLGVLEISLGNYGAALSCLDPAYTDDTPLIGTQALPELVEAAVRAGRRDLAERALRRLAARATATGTPLALGLLARSRALLDAPTEARQEYEDALHLLGRTRAAPQLARTHLLYGEWLRRQRRRREARDQLHAALDMFDAMGLPCFAERARVELQATGERARKREVGTLEELTPREAQIAALVSRGEANQEIAAKLFVSPSTVEYHLRKVFRKLEVTSRTQLAHRVINHGLGALPPIPAPERRPLPDSHR
ncbi:MAG TPA: LuxR C-terminal-related transcriptional regulator [Pseudonocardia sp.]|uniref:helix-turn-helix transcriptional regulator n=1 Tax=Pseudonocardia sp. TaxID=60912 RepID=UPI002B5CD87F|nr:LuxR C-terminal-related transcriptional regulator [Pseudonocardia sp.]HTF49762.1 LuxR C-terminal-related transcriptional regulator [Pseudonocardia sp.]